MLYGDNDDDDATIYTAETLGTLIYAGRLMHIFMYIYIHTYLLIILYTRKLLIVS